MPSSTERSFLIIGAGVFAASTAYHLKRTHPSVSVTIVDRQPYPCQLAASWDWNKIVRADYGDIFYVEKALEAVRLWRSDPLYKPFYHQSGIINIDNTGLGRRMLDNFRQLKVDESEAAPEILTPAEFRDRFGSLYTDIDLEKVEDVYYNSKSGWAEASKALHAVIEQAVKDGVEYVAGDVSKLIFDSDGSCSGVQLADGSQLSASSIVLSTGAGTAQLLTDSAPDRTELHSGDRITAAAVCTGQVKLTPTQVQKFKDIPVLVHAVGETMGETMPPTPDGVLKFCRDVSFKNTHRDERTGETISAPPDAPGQKQRSPSQEVTKALNPVRYGIYGSAASDLEFDSFRVCWDGITPNQDFIISPHPRCEERFIATGGSFHGWKFLPILGSYVVSMLYGELDGVLMKRWAWDRDNKGEAHGKLIPRKELRDIESGKIKL